MRWVKASIVNIYVEVKCGGWPVASSCMHASRVVIFNSIRGIKMRRVVA